MRYSSYSEDWEITPHGSAGAKTVVLVGKTGNGKSATGNTVIGRQVFDSEFSLGGVTASCQLETTILDGGQTLNVIDTPGLFDSCVEPDEMTKEIAKCIDLAKDGIHALLLVLSLGGRFSEEEASAFESLCHIFGGNISDYMIVVFTSGDRLPENKSLDDFLGRNRNCPKILKSTLEMCGNRTVVFDNKTKDEGKIRRQRDELLSLIDGVVEKNGGKPYTNDLFQEVKREQMNQIALTDEGKSPKGEFRYSNDFVAMVELRLKESVLNLEKQLAEMRVARAEAETKAKDEAHQMKERLILAEEKSRLLEEQMKNKSSLLEEQIKNKSMLLEEQIKNKCVIM